MSDQNLETITVRISPVIEREFKRRGAFAELRIENAWRVVNGSSGDHKVSVARAKELITDIQAMRAHNRELPHGIPVAYSALLRNIAASLEKLEARRCHEVNRVVDEKWFETAPKSHLSLMQEFSSSWGIRQFEEHMDALKEAFSAMKYGPANGPTVRRHSGYLGTRW